ncbi:hypothetical protein [Alkalimonas mucilaginosa]|uniref:MSHA biogenesis protein MshJ n=1 Tax=Alkalimonas mucilaginosa TaxID=3057676 RepID=A0ABU7JLT7_9GAMM|nr:hypothetical protein [Alkalimonas sp. MEB004]MEE2025928.1 hypothetical protein [Alkalimonas sp. MEB004]
MNWQQLKHRYDTLKLRERRLVFFASLVLLLWLVAIYWLEPAWQASQQQQQELRQARQQLQQTELSIAELQRELGRDIDQDTRQRIARLEQRLALEEQQLAERAVHFIGADRMLPMLQNLLISDPDVRLLSLSSQAPKVIAHDEAQQALLYEHRIQLVLQGEYQALSAMMQQLEQLPWQLGWRNVHYRVMQHPLAELSIEIVTVGDHADFIQL